MHKTTVNLRPAVWLRLRNRAQREGVGVETLINDLLDEILAPVDGSFPSSIGAGDADVVDLGVNAKRYVRDALR